MPTVSLVIPTHNRSELLARAVSSALNQSRPPDEIIVVDDSSTDDTPRVLDSFGAAVTVVRSPQNVERGAARNLGARAASGRLLAFLDSDDEWLPEKLERQLAYHDGAGASVTGIHFVDDEDRPQRAPYLPPPDAEARVLYRNLYLGSPSSLLIDRELFLRLDGFPQEWSLQGSEDWIFLNRLVRAGAAPRVVPEHLVRYRVHPNNSTANPDRVALSMWTGVEWLEHHGFVAGEELRTLRGHTACVIGRGFAARGRYRESRAWMVRAIRRGTTAEGVQAATMIPVSAVRGMLRRRGV